MDDLISRQPEQRTLTEDDYAYCTECDHVEMCRWYPMYGCEFKSRPSAQPEPQWIPCSERLPERIIDDDVETVQEFFVTVKERWPGEEWKYHTDIAEYPGDYIDDVWQTFNDWREGQEVHVIAWMPLPPSYKGDEDERN